LRWPHATLEQTRDAYRALALGLSAQAHRQLGQLEAASQALAARRDLLAAKLRGSGVDADVAALAAAEGQLAELAHARGDLGAAARHVAAGLRHADDFGKRTGTPIHPAQLTLLSFAAELHLRAGVALADFDFDLAERLRTTYAATCERRNPAWRAAQKRLALYLTLLALPR
jgi:hypothetical protein